MTQGTDVSTWLGIIEEKAKKCPKRFNIWKFLDTVDTLVGDDADDFSWSTSDRRPCSGQCITAPEQWK